MIDINLLEPLVLEAINHGHYGIIYRKYKSGINALPELRKLKEDKFNSWFGRHVRDYVQSIMALAVKYRKIQRIDLSKLNADQKKAVDFIMNKIDRLLKMGLNPRILHKEKLYIPKEESIKTYECNTDFGDVLAQNEMLRFELAVRS